MLILPSILTFIGIASEERLKVFVKIKGRGPKKVKNFTKKLYFFDGLRDLNLAGKLTIQVGHHQSFLFFGWSRFCLF